MDFLLDKLLDMCSAPLERQLKADTLNALFRAHFSAAANNANASGQAAAQCAVGGSGLHATIIGAMASIGGRHAPVTAARKVLFRSDPVQIERALRDGLLIPGFGNSFFKDQIDPSWVDCAAFLRMHFPEPCARLDQIAEILAARGKAAHPNAAAFTAVSCEVLGMPWGSEPLMFLLPRSLVWTADHVARASRFPGVFAG